MIFEIRRELGRLPKDLWDLYHDIAKRLHHSLDTSELEMARRVLVWTCGRGYSVVRCQ